MSHLNFFVGPIAHLVLLAEGKYLTGRQVKLGVRNNNNNNIIINNNINNNSNNNSNNNNNDYLY